MRIKKLNIHNVRSIKELSFDATESINFLCGPNGSGKSAILEAIHLLSNGKSFRTHITSELIKKNQNELIVRSDFSGTVAGQHSVGLLKRINGDLLLRLDQKDVKSTAEVARLFPVRTIHPDMHELVKGGPSIRRKFLDWGVFHVEQNFHIFWKRFNFALKQRNNLLKNKNVSKNEIIAWGKELAESGAAITIQRKNYLNDLESFFRNWVEHFRVDADVSLHYKQGWEKNLDLDEAIAVAMDSCIRYRTTTVGPHRADLGLNFDGYPAKQFVSRGQQKLLVYALVLAQIELHRKKTMDYPVLLCDDPEAEMDFEHRELFVKGIRKLGIQTFITGNDSDTWDTEKDERKFVVKNGLISIVK